MHAQGHFLGKASLNTLKEVGRENDMDNNHMLALIARKMFSDDRKVWARHLESTKSEATLENMISWMTSEMKSRMRATYHGLHQKSVMI